MVTVSLLGLGCAQKSKTAANAFLCNGTSNTVQPKKILFEEDFFTLENWHKEGFIDGVSIPQPGLLRMDCTGSAQGGTGAMAFCKQDFPDNIALEFDLVIKNRNGLLIVFIAMQGIHGEDAITGVPPRSGVFKDYVGENSSTRSYHVSVCRYNDKGEHTGVSNWRRNPGLNLMASGKDLCTQIGRIYHIRVTKQGPFCRIEVDGQPAVEFMDNQTLVGPIPTSGKIGFRAIGSKATFEISNLKVLSSEN